MSNLQANTLNFLVHKMLDNIEVVKPKNGKGRPKKNATPAEPTLSIDQVTDEFVNATAFFQKRIVKE